MCNAKQNIGFVTAVMQRTLQKPGMLFDIYHPHSSLGVRHQDPLEQSQAGWRYWDVCRDGVVPSDYFLGKGGIPSLEGVLTIQHGIQNDPTRPDVCFLQAAHNSCDISCCCIRKEPHSCQFDTTLLLVCAVMMKAACSSCLGRRP